MTIIKRFKKLSFWNKVGFIGAIASIIGLIIYFIPSDSKTKVKSKNQSGGITAGNIENINLTTINQSDSKIEEQIIKDSQIALIYQTEILHYFSKFKTCLHWTLPLNSQVDKEIDKVFKYGRDYSKGFDFDNMTKNVVKKIFVDYDFTKAMPNYSGEKGFHPTGFNNILGILKYFDFQLDKHLNKYGSSISTELAVKIEYMQRTVKSAISSIRIDLNTEQQINNATIDEIANLIIMMRDDYLLMINTYTKNIKGGYPVQVGKITKSDSIDGQIVVETQFSNYD